MRIEIEGRLGSCKCITTLRIDDLQLLVNEDVILPAERMMIIRAALNLTPQEADDTGVV